MDLGHLKRLLLFFVLLIFVLSAIEKILVYGIIHSDYNYYSKVSKVVGHKIDPEVVFFGSSVGDVSLDPAKLKPYGLTGYNLCIDGTRFLQYNGLIKEFNEYSDSCKIIVLAETFFTLSKTNQLTEADRFLAHIKNDKLYASLFAIQPDIAWKLRYIPFYSFVMIKHGYYKAASIGLKSRLSGREHPDVLKGFTPRDKQWEAGLDELNQKSKPMPVKIDSATWQQYRNVINEIRKKGRRVLVILPPIQEDGLRLLPQLDTLRNTLSSLQTEGVYFRDYSNSVISKKKEYFYNNTHVNRTGAEWFSSRLSADIDSILHSKRAFTR